MNVCYPTFLRQITPRHFAPLWNPCKLHDRFIDAVSEVQQCRGLEGEMERDDCARDAVRNTKLRYLGAGVHRTAYSYGACVVKIAMTNEGDLANKGEWESWRKVGRHFSDIFVPVHEHAKDFGWITQPRLVPISRMQTAKYKDLKWNLEERMKQKGILCGDTHGGNIGVRAGKGANVGYLFDYGFGLSCRIRRPDGSTSVVTVRGAPG